jgi:hypothetical protein
MMMMMKMMLMIIIIIIVIIHISILSSKNLKEGFCLKDPSLYRRIILKGLLTKHGDICGLD